MAIKSIPLSEGTPVDKSFSLEQKRVSKPLGVVTSSFKQEKRNPSPVAPTKTNGEDLARSMVPEGSKKKSSCSCGEL